MVTLADEALYTTWEVRMWRDLLKYYKANTVNTVFSTSLTGSICMANNVLTQKLCTD